MAAAPTLYVIAGPNGAGKSTLTASGALPVPSLDPDAFTRPGDDSWVTLGRRVHQRFEELQAAGRSFAIETTLSGRTIRLRICRIIAAGWRCELHFIGLCPLDLAKARVRQRVAEGGHDIPEAIQERRFPRSFANIAPLARMADETWLYDNSGLQLKRLARLCDGALEFFDTPSPIWAERAMQAYRS